MSDKSTENYLDNLLDSMNKLQDTDTKMSGTDQDEFLKKFEDELENETYDEYLSNFEKELERENEQAKGQALMYRLRLLMTRMLHLMICSLSLTAG